MITNILLKYPVLILVICFAMLITAWSSLIIIAVKFRSEPVPIAQGEATHP